MRMTIEFVILNDAALEPNHLTECGKNSSQCCAEPEAAPSALAAETRTK